MLPRTGDTFLLPPAPLRPDPTCSGHARTGCARFLYNNFSFSAAAHHMSEASFHSLPYGIWLLFSCLYFCMNTLAKVSSVMAETDIFTVQIFPCPVKSCQFAVTRILRGNMVSRIIRKISQRFFPFRPHMKRYIYIVIGHPVFLWAATSILISTLYFPLCHGKRTFNNGIHVVILVFP